MKETKVGETDASKIGEETAEVKLTVAYVTNEYDNTVSVIDIVARQVLATIPVGSLPSDIVVHPNGRQVYVVSYLDNTISIIDTYTHSVLDAKIQLENLCWGGVTFSPDGTHAYFSSPTRDVVSVFNINLNRVVDTILLQGNYLGMAITADGSRAYVISWQVRSVFVINLSTGKEVTTIRLGMTARPQAIALHPDGSRAYVVNSHGEDPGAVSVINLSTDTVCAIIPVDVYPHGIAIHPNGLWAYVSSSCDERVSVINTMRNEVERTICTGMEPLGIAITPDGNSVCVVNASERTVSIISTSENKETAVIRVGEKPREVAIASIVITDSMIFHMS
jgi:YVTN family beta-propeller protein